MKLRLRCREAFRLMLESEDRPLRPLERWTLRAHVWVCRRCPGAESQLQLMRAAMPAWRAYRDELGEPDDRGAAGTPPAASGSPSR